MNPLDDSRPIVVVCDWHEDKAKRYAEVHAAGGRVSGTICPECRAKFAPGTTHRLTREQAESVLGEVGRG